ncbi:PKD domain-containing protein [Candidatus Peregrinibacteria bacterium]|nr:PKD domain-containing protein [Candidatus Peregrinibacteria bacterium]
MKKLLISILIAFLLLPSILMTQTANAVEFDLNKIRPVITADQVVQVGKNIIFDASSSFLIDNDEPIKYMWDFGDDSGISREIEAVHTYSEPGNYLVTLTITQGEEVESVQRDVFAYTKLILMLTDVTEMKDSIANFKAEAEEDGIYIFLLDSYESTTAFMSEESLSKKLSDQVSILNNADPIITWTSRGSGVNALTRLIQQPTEDEQIKIKESLKGKSIVVITDDNINTLARIMQANYNIINPEQIVIVRQTELNNLITSENMQEFVSKLETRFSDYSIINEETGRVGIWNSISYLVSFMITKGIPSNTIVLLLMLPVIATIIAFLKQVIGITTFGLYTPSIITLSFLALGLKFGLVILVIIIFTGAILRKALDRFRLLHIPRIAIVLTISTLIILLMLAFGAFMGISQIATIAVFPMLIMTTLAEKFVSALGGKGFYSALLLMFETTVVSLICYWVVEWQYLQNLILGHPEIILLLILVNYALGRWTGLRLMEYVRFREVMKHAEE